MTKYWKLIGAVAAGLVAVLTTYFTDPSVDPVWVAAAVMVLSSIAVFFAPKNTT